MNLNILNKKINRLKKEKFSLVDLLRNTFKLSFYEINPDIVYEGKLEEIKIFNLIIGKNLERENNRLKMIHENSIIKISYNEYEKKFLKKVTKNKIVNYYLLNDTELILYTSGILINLESNQKKSEFLEFKNFSILDIKTSYDCKYENGNLILIVKNIKNQIEKLILDFSSLKITSQSLEMEDNNKIQFYKNNYLYMKRFDKSLFSNYNTMKGLEKIREKILDFLIVEKDNLLILLFKNKVNLYSITIEDENINFEILDTINFDYLLNKLELDNNFVKIKNNDINSITLILKIVRNNNNFRLKNFYLTDSYVHIFDFQNKVIINEIRDGCFTQKIVNSEEFVIVEKDFFVKKLKLNNKENFKNLEEIVIKKKYGFNFYLLGQKNMILMKFNKNLHLSKEILPYNMTEKLIFKGGFEGKNKNDFLFLNYHGKDNMKLIIYDVKREKSLILSVKHPIEFFEYYKEANILIFSCNKIIIFLKIHENEIENFDSMKNILFDSRITSIRMRNKEEENLNENVLNKDKKISDFVLISDNKNSVHIYELYYKNEIVYKAGDFKGRDVKLTGWLNHDNFYIIEKNNNLLFFSVNKIEFKVLKNKKNKIEIKIKESPFDLFENSLFPFYKFHFRSEIINFYLLEKFQIKIFLSEMNLKFFDNFFDFISIGGLILFQDGNIKLILNFENINHSLITNDKDLEKLYLINSSYKNDDQNLNVFFYDILEIIEKQELLKDKD